VLKIFELKETRPRAKDVSLSTATMCGGNLPNVNNVNCKTRILILEYGQYKLMQCPLVEPPDNVKNSVGVMLVSPFKIEYHLNLGSGCISMFFVNPTFDKILMMQFCYIFLQKSQPFGL